MLYLFHQVKITFKIIILFLTTQFPIASLYNRHEKDLIYIYNIQNSNNYEKFLNETYYTCTFKTVHSLDDLNEKETIQN